MDYTCKCCEVLTDAYDMDEIIRSEKLCWKCIKLTDAERDIVRKRVYGIKNQFQKQSLVKVKPKSTGKVRKGKVKKSYDYICNNCLHPHRNFRPHRCDTCGSQKFHTIEITPSKKLSV